MYENCHAEFILRDMRFFAVLRMTLRSCSTILVG